MFDPGEGKDSLDYYHKHQLELLDNYKKGKETVSFAGYNDWHLPVLEEGSTLLMQIENSQGCYYIGDVFFPAELEKTQNIEQYCGVVWSASPYAVNTHFAWEMLFVNGNICNDSRYHSKHIRLVRKGQ